MGRLLRRDFMKYAACIVIVITLIFASGCTRFEVIDPATGQTLVKTTGAPFLTRRDGFSIRREWLDSDNVLHSFEVSRNTDENADAQIRALELVKEAFMARYAVLAPEIK